MKPIVYFFGSFPSGFASTPKDHTETFFRNFLTKAKNDAQVALLRKGNLLYYSYMRRLSNNSFLGFCVCFDCIYCNFNHFFRVCDEIYAKMVQCGDIVKISSEDSVDWAIKNFTDDSVAVSKYSLEIIEKLNVEHSETKNLPLEDFSVSLDDCLDISLEEPSKRIVAAIEHYSNVYIVKHRAEIEKISSFASQIKSKNSEILKLQQEITTLKTENLKNQNAIVSKKQQGGTLLLFVVLLIAFFAAIVLYKKNNDTKKKLVAAERLVKERNSTIQSITESNAIQLASLQEKIDELSYDLSKLRGYRFSVGPMIGGPDNISGYDNSFVLWLKADIPVAVKSFDILPNNSGRVEISICSSNGTLIGKKETYVESGSVKTVSCNFELQSGYYYMYISQANNISLAWNSSDWGDFNMYSTGPLKVTGASSYNDVNDISSRTKTNWYQYFYNIKYSLLAED